MFQRFFGNFFYFSNADISFFFLQKFLTMLRFFLGNFLTFQGFLRKTRKLIKWIKMFCSFLFGKFSAFQTHKFSCSFSKISDINLILSEFFNTIFWVFKLRNFLEFFWDSSQNLWYFLANVWFFKLMHFLDFLAEIDSVFQYSI